jgi:hypothetical protein
VSGRLQPVDYAQIDSAGVLEADWAFYRQPWVPVGTYPHVAQFDGGRVEATQRPTNLPHGRPVAVLPAFNISGYVWIGQNPSTDADEYHMQGEISYGCTGSNVMTGQVLALVRLNAGKWEQIGRRAFTDTTLPTPGGAAVTTTCVPWAFPLTQASRFQPGGMYYESAAAGELGVSTEILPDFESSPFYGGPQTIFVDWMILLPGPGAGTIPPLRQSQRDDIRASQLTSRQRSIRQNAYL